MTYILTALSRFVIDVSSTMARTRSVNLQPGPNGEGRTREISNLEWALQFVLLKVQEIVSEIHFLLHNMYGFTHARSFTNGKQINVALFLLEHKVWFYRLTWTPSDPVKGTDNRVHEASGDGYENVTEFLPIEQPTPDTLTKIAALMPTQGIAGDRE